MTSRSTQPWHYVIALAVLMCGCQTVQPAQELDYSSPPSASILSAQKVDINYGCPDLFEGHIFSCPTVPMISAGVDVDTDSKGIGVGLECNQGHGGICVAPSISFGTGSESYQSDFFFEKRGDSFADLDYRVFQIHAQGQYPFALNADTSLTVSPIVGPRYYRFSYKDCPFNDCTENLLVLDVGAGVRWKNFGLDVFTGLNGPNFTARGKVIFGR